MTTRSFIIWFLTKCIIPDILIMIHFLYTFLKGNRYSLISIVRLLPKSLDYDPKVSNIVHSINFNQYFWPYVRLFRFLNLESYALPKIPSFLLENHTPHGAILFKHKTLKTFLHILFRFLKNKEQQFKNVWKLWCIHSYPCLLMLKLSLRAQCDRTLTTNPGNLILNCNS